MTNKVYPKFNQELMKCNANNQLNSSEGATGVYCTLVDTGTYTYSDSHQYYSNLSGIVGTPQEILSKTVNDGVFDGADITFPSVSGSSAEALIFYRKNSGANTTWPLICYIDSGVTGLPVTPNSGDIAVIFNASGIFKL